LQVGQPNNKAVKKGEAERKGMSKITTQQNRGGKIQLKE